MNALSKKTEPLHEKQAVALSSIAASAAMAAGKFAVGLATGSLGVMSEALHSLLDLGATVLTFLAVRAGDKPPDSEHPYGHGKIESVAALAETGLLFLTSFWIVEEAGRRLWFGEKNVQTTYASIGVILASILIDISRARALKRVAKKTRSAALEADALHFSSDVLSSGVVLAGLALVDLGFPWADSLAAIGVALFVCHAGWVLGKRTIDTLIDAAPDGAMKRVQALIETVPGVVAATRVRVRPVGPALFVDAYVAVGRGLAQTRVNAIVRDIVQAVQREIPEAEMTIATQPLALDTETAHERVSIIARNHNVDVHHVTAQQTDDLLFIGMDLEVDEFLTLRQAHEIATQLENDIREEFGGEIEVETHIEPLQTVKTMGQDVDPDELRKIAQKIARLANETRFVQDVHKVRARRDAQGLTVVFHCRLEASLRVGEIHDIMDDLERAIRRAYPDIRRIVGHAEPAQAT